MVRYQLAVLARQVVHTFVDRAEGARTPAPYERRIAECDLRAERSVQLSAALTGVSRTA
jgi:hypothetical protein